MSEHIPRDFIDQLLNGVDIVDLIDGRVPLKKKTGSNFFACCPFHSEKNASFSVSQTKQFYYCFGCGAHGNAIDFLIQFDRLSFPEAIETLAQLMGLEVPRQATAFAAPNKSAAQKPLYDILEQAAKFFQTQLRQHTQAARAVAYLKERGVSGEIAKDFCLGFAPDSWDSLLQAFEPHKAQLLEAGMLIKKEEGGFYDRFRDRVMFPILDRRGRMVGFGGRIIDKGEPKYLNSPETPIFQKGHELYGLYQALQANRTLSRVIVVEGYMDVIALFQNGITYAVATLGTATTASHLQRLFRHTSEIIFCFDGDNAGKTAAWRALQVTLPLLQDGAQVRFLFLPDGEDPDSMVRKEGQEKFEERVQKSAPIADFFFQTLAAQADITSMDGRARFVKLATDLLKQLPEGIFQQMMLEELAKRARIDIEKIAPARAATLSAVTSKTPSLKARPPSALRLAMTLLVQQPKLVELITQPLPPLTMPGFDLFLKIIAVARENPDMNSAALIERWRDQPEWETLKKLSARQHMISDLGMTHEFSGSVLQLYKLARDEAIERMLSKASLSELSSEEKQQLTELINSKQ